MKQIRWGIVATGGIAAKFAEACSFESSRTGRSVLAAVASRDRKKAAEFAEKWHIGRHYGSYDELFADPAIDAVYIATPHSSHAALSIAALEAGKAVLCEKPVSLNLAEFRPVVETAKRKNRFFMEAMWMKFNPSFRKALSWVSEGYIGDPKFVRADFFMDAPFNPQSRLYDPALGGGALLDVGIYPVTCALAVSGGKKPAFLNALMHTGSTGVDLYNKAHMVWENGLIADLSSAISLQGIEELRSAAIIGETGSILLPFFWMAQKAVLLDAQGNEVEIFDGAFACNGYEHEIREVEECLGEGKTESPVQTWADSIMVMEILDDIRKVSKQMNGGK
ncbi:MAG TPA: Gfo/Idh/MocA family oxidoreductase [Treponemataceae bacterium]|nr:Gfo/Idh/MocA family oxidoreductase [Treponemataceae bacterium]HPS45440.1 Gfo/Idh/MocA family oxidoreductase [Treponemataceae bacterium]